MAILADYNFHGVTIPSTYIRIIRVYGGKPEGKWECLARVFKSKADADYEPSETELSMGNLPARWIDEFNHLEWYQPDVLPYELLYEGLKVKYNGIDI